MGRSTGSFASYRAFFVSAALCLFLVVCHLEFAGWEDAHFGRAAVRVTFSPGLAAAPTYPRAAAGTQGRERAGLVPAPRAAPPATTVTTTPEAPFDLWAPWETVRKNDLAAAARAGHGAGSEAAVKVFVTCTYNKGRSGHELKDVATPFIFGVMYGWTPCHGKWWKTKPVKMFNPALGLVDCETYRAKDGQPSMNERLGATRVHSVVHRQTSYDGMSFDDVRAVGAKVDAAVARAKPGEAVLVSFQKSTRVHMHQLYTWWRQGMLQHAVFEPVRRTLQARWFHYMNRLVPTMSNVELPPTLPYLAQGPECRGNTNASSMCVEYAPPAPGATAANRDGSSPGARGHRPPGDLVVAAHFRRGDVKHMSYGEFTGPAFAQRMVNGLRAQLSACKGRAVEVNLHTESRGAEDLTKRPGIKNASHIYSKESWEHDMMAFVNADVLVVTNSSMSTWAALFGRGRPPSPPFRSCLRVLRIGPCRKQNHGSFRNPVDARRPTAARAHVRPTAAMHTCLTCSARVSTKLCPSCSQTHTWHVQLISLMPTRTRARTRVLTRQACATVRQAWSSCQLGTSSTSTSNRIQIFSFRLLRMSIYRKRGWRRAGACLEAPHRPPKRLGSGCEGSMSTINI